MIHFVTLKLMHSLNDMLANRFTFGNLNLKYNLNAKTESLTASIIRCISAAI